MDIIEGPYVADILDQPEALARTIASLKVDASLRDHGAAQPGRPIVLTGMGSSYHALYPLQLSLIAAGHMAHRVETAELVQYQPTLLRGDVLVVAVSQSGRSAETLLLLDQLGAGAELIGVTNDATSPLATVSRTRILLQAGPEATVSCKTYLATLAALEVLGGVLTGTRSDWSALEQGPDAVANYLTNWREHVQETAEVLRGKSLYFTGRGRSLATVGTGALIFKEATRSAAEGMSAAAFRHGPIELVGADTLVALFAGEPATRDLNVRLAADIRSAGGTAVLIGDDTDRPAFRVAPATGPLAQIMEILPIQMMTLAAAASNGREAGRFSVALKVTAVA